MYVNIGSNKHIPTEEIIGVFDIDNTANSKELIKYLQNAEKNKKIINAAKEIPRSFILCGKKNGKDKEEKIYLSPFSVSTLKNRLK